MKKSSKSTELQNDPLLRKIFIGIVIIIPFILALQSFLFGHISLWYDPSRDLMSAWNNLSKPTLIGPTSGIPGIFYGPYWIWLLSFGLIFSKDPSVVAFITATLPYFILFPLIWFRYSKFFGLAAVACGWLLFMLSTGKTYATQLWNPHPAPLLTLLVIYLLIIVNIKELSKRNLIISVLLGFFLGLVITFHISFGIALLCGVLLFFLIDTVWSFINDTDKKGFIKTRAAFYAAVGVGFFIAYIPTLLFEVRHGFNQIQVLLHTFTQYGAVVAVKGLSKPLILQEFINTFGKILHVQATIASIILLLLPLSYLFLVIRKKIPFTQIDQRIITILLSILGGIMIIYFTARNPVWTYHFIGVDLILLLLLVFFVSKMSLYKKAIMVWTIFVVVSVFSNQISSFNPNQVTGFYEQKNIVNTIAADAQNTEYTVMAYSASIYMYEYSYLFRWLVNKDVPFDPSANPQSNVVYLIVPVEEDAKVKDFINYRTPQALYTSEKTWNMQFNKVIKRVKVVK